MSSVYKIKKAQTFPISISQAWDFFSSPDNLPKITPPDLGLTITSDSPGNGKMYTGQIIEYTVKPVLGIPQYWMTEITHVEHEKFFIDEQRVGPYSIWHHQHLFKETGNGIEMTDIIHYKLPLWILGDIANSLFVKNQLAKIFDYRFKKAEELFGKK
jgi:ligand-binding SRPBCC domain-containing protein